MVAAVVHSWRPLLFAVVVTLGMGAVYDGTTHVIHRDRPPVRILDPGLVPDHSFPSGHTGTATALALGTALLLVTYGFVAHRVVERVVVGLLALVPLAVLLARLYQGAHHLTDVLTSLIYTCVWVPGGGRAGAPRAPRARLAGARGRGGAPQPSSRSRFSAALISDRWVKAWGKLPSCSPARPTCSAYRPRWLA